MSEALRRLKQDMGRDAVILHTRTLRRGGLFGLGARNFVEITASDDTGLTVREPPRVETHAPTVQTGEVMAELRALRERVDKLVLRSREPAPSAPQSELHEQLLSAGVTPEIAHDLLEGAMNDRGVVTERIAQCIRVTGDVETQSNTPRLAAFVGPTGNGKTTTIAKLAARARLRDQRRVGLITLDQYRIGAVEQLKTFAEILEVPLISAASVGEVEAARMRLADCELILLDTAGRAPTDEPRLGELQSLLAAAAPDEIHLVLSAAAGDAAAQRAVERFGAIGADRILFTKLDEAVGCGVILNIVRRTNAWLSFVTNGQSVPDDIAVAEAQKIAAMILPPVAATGSIPAAPIAPEGILA